ncbi:GDP-mannose 4,6-dehydratase [bacterium]|nr:GDP-mannose 4,6-dehydratase [bacterium]
MNKKKIIVTGGAGFIGVNLVIELLKNKNNFVVVFDNLSRKGTENNLNYLLSQKYKNLEFVKGDIRDYNQLKDVMQECKEIYHLAAQVAVTKSVEDPVEDFKINAEGTLYLLEATRKVVPEAIFTFASTNKVYGALSHIKLKEGKKRYLLCSKRKGVSEKECLDLYSPYGVSKGVADQYVRDYHRIYGLKTIVFRQSCIYGKFQYGNEDQGWVAHFIIKSILDGKLNIYGDGKQIRDLLEVSDLVKAYLSAVKKIKKTEGKIYNIGGGADNTLSLLEFIELLKGSLKLDIEYSFSDWRPGDQKVFVSDNSKLETEVGWKPKISKEKGIEQLTGWIWKNISLIEKVNKKK